MVGSRHQQQLYFSLLQVPLGPLLRNRKSSCNIVDMTTRHHKACENDRSLGFFPKKALPIKIRLLLLVTDRVPGISRK